MSDIHVALVKDALNKLVEAEKLLIADTSPATVLPRLKTFVVVPRLVVWPRLGFDPLMVKASPIDSGPGTANIGFSYGKVQLMYIKTADRADTTSKLITLCDNRPKRVLHVISVIHSICEWCEKRASGRLKMAREIVKQQAAAFEQLEELAAMAALSKISKP